MSDLTRVPRNITPIVLVTEASPRVAVQLSLPMIPRLPAQFEEC